MKKEIKEFDKTIQERIMNKDNPQYVLGWNACRYLAREFINKALSQQKKEIERMIMEMKADESKGWELVDEFNCCPGDDMADAYNSALCDILNKIEKV